MFGRTQRHRRLGVTAVIAVSLIAASCGSDKPSSSAASSTTAASGTATSGSLVSSTAAGSGGTCVDGDTVKLGFLNSTSGVMAISEQTVRDSLTLASEEINAGGGILGKQIKFVAEDGQSEGQFQRSVHGPGLTDP